MGISFVFMIAPMGKWIHRLSNIDTENRMADCAHCGRVRIRSKSGGTWKCLNAILEWKNAYIKRWRKTDAGKAHIQKMNRLHAIKKYRKFCGIQCERCGFIGFHINQLDVHHKDGDHNNNLKDNLETLCANCHRLEHCPEWLYGPWPVVAYT